MTTATSPIPGRLSAPACARILLFGSAMFVSAALVFALEPLIAKMILPQLGGSPAVWNTSMMFFQAALLAGYGYAYALQRLMPLRVQIPVHLGILAAAALALPVAVSGVLGTPPVDNPVWWLLSVLTLSIGAPFATLCSTAPLLQSWYVHLQRDSAAPQNPYILYSASNLGSMLALLAYPALVEPAWTLARQSLVWTFLYVLFLALTVCIGITVLRNDGGAVLPIPREPSRRTAWSRRMCWIALAAVPSSLMLGTTSFIANDIASVPLFWVVPLALYLLTFVISFQDRPAIPYESALRWQSVFAALAAGLLCMPIVVLALNLTVFLGALFFGALICHQALVADRPHESNLTEFYLLISAGGVLGGVFNTLLAPVLFHTVLEFPLMLVLVCLARPWTTGRPYRREILVAALGISAAVAIAFIPADGFAGALQLIVILAAAGSLAAVLANRHVLLFTLVIAVLCAQAALIAPNRNTAMFAIRSFFGVSRVVAMSDGRAGAMHVLYHGTTIHGSQAMALDRRCVPGTYYAPATPIGETVIALQRLHPALHIGVVGLGAGAISAYSRAADRMRYFEIDPAVARIARDPRYFTYLSQCAKGKTDIILGDARLTLARQSAGQFDIVILDAFSADNIPTHLMTREAFALYFRALKPDGIALLHITNRNLALEAPAAATAKAAGASARVKIFTPPADTNGLVAAASKVMLMSRSPAALAEITRTPGWHRPDDRDVRPWTDEYTNIAGALYDHTIRHLP